MGKALGRDKLTIVNVPLPIAGLSAVISGFKCRQIGKFLAASLELESGTNIAKRAPADGLPMTKRL